MRKRMERASAEERRKFSMIWGEKTTTQQAMDIDLGIHQWMAAIDGIWDTHPQIPLNASMSRLRAGEIDMVASAEDATIDSSGFSFRGYSTLEA